MDVKQIKSVSYYKLHLPVMVKASFWGLIGQIPGNLIFLELNFSGLTF